MYTPKKVRSLFSVLLVICFIAFLAPAPTGAASLRQDKNPKDPGFAGVVVEPPVVTLGNTYIQASVSESGRFVIGTTGGDPATPNDNNKRLLFGYPSGIWSTYPSVRINNGGTVHDYMLGYTEAPIAYPTSNGGTLLVVWNEEGVRVEQRISFALNPVTGRLDTSAIEYTLQNTNSSSRSVGLRLMMDVMVGDNDGAPYFILGNGQVTQQFEWTGANVPDYWIAYESPSFDPNGLQGRGQLAGSGATRPNRFVIADWADAYGTAWNYTVDPSDPVTNDSAVLLYYNPVTVQAGEKLIYRTYYGINAANQTPQLELTGLEATQAIQNLNDDVVLVNGKPTFVRALVQSRSGTINNVTARLIGKRNGTELPGSPLAPANKGGTVNVRENADANRKNLTDSFYFELPPSWRSGTVDLEFKGENQTIACKEHAGTDNDCKVQIVFSDAPLPDVRFVGVTWKEGNVSHTPTSATIREVVQQLKTTYPIADLQWDYPYSIEPVFLATQPSNALEFMRLNSMLGIQRTLDGCVFGCDRIYMGVIVDPPTGVSYVAGLSTGDVLSGYSDDDNTLSHELGHTAGRSHTKCDGSEAGTDSSYPYANGRISTNTSGDNAFYGFHIVTKRIYSPQTGDLMGYCSPNWPSDWTYTHIRDNLVTRFGSPGFLGTMATDVSPGLLAGDPAMVISGTVHLLTNQGTLDSIYAIDSPANAPLPAPGTFAIKFENAIGQQLALYSFEPSYGSEDEEEGIFTLLLPRNPSTARIILLHDSVELDSRLASSHAPSVTITYPNGGETLDGSTATLSWSAGDQDGDALEYAVQYSTDAGVSWQTLASGLTSPTYLLHLESIAGTDEGLIRVLASDGFHTTQDQSDAVFIVVKHPPQAVIEAPQSNSLYVGDQTVILEGYGYDNEDKQLADGALFWNSDVDGPLGTGKSLAINAASLTEGMHVITLTAQDSDGQIGFDQIVVQIDRQRPTLPAVLSVAPNVLLLTGYEGGAETAGELISVRNDGDGSMYWVATADQNWILLSTVAGYAPTDFLVVADPAGLSIGNYTGNITITSDEADDSPQTIPVTLQIRDAPPTLSNINRTSTYLTSASSVSFSVTFSEAVQNVDSADFALASTGVSGAAISSVTGAGASYTVTVNTGTGNGTIRLDVPLSANVQDLAGNPLASLPFIGGQGYRIVKSPTFVDVQFNHWAWGFIERLYAAGITGGCSSVPIKYCPETTVNRAQMAVFLLRGIHGSAYSPPDVGASTGFSDVPANYWAAAWIKQLAVEGITGGCGNGKYCPETPVTRDQMAVFLLRSKYGANYSPPEVGTGTGFGDVPPDHWAAAWIKQLVAEAITAGCGNGNYCPSVPVSRAQMAVFLVRTFNLP